MARYSPTFLNRIGQTPSFGKRLTEIAGGLTAYPGMIAEQNKIKGMGMLDLAKYNLEKARTPAERAQALSVLEQAKQQTANAAIDPLFTAASKSNDPNQIKSLSQSAQNVASYFSLPTAEIAEKFQGMMTGRQQSNAKIAADRLMLAIQQSEDPRIQDSLNETLVDTLARADLPTANAVNFAAQHRANMQANKLAEARAKDYYDTQAQQAANQNWNEYANRSVNEINQIINTIDLDNPDQNLVAKAQSIQESIFNRANEEGKDGTPYQLMFEKGYKARIENRRQENKAAREQADAQRKELTTALAKQMFDSSTNIPNPVSWIDARLMTNQFRGIENPEEFKANVLEEFNLLVDRRTSQEEVQRKGELSEEDKSWLRDPKNKGYFQNYPEAMELNRLYSQTEDARLKRSYATQLNNFITAAQADQRKFASDDKVLQASITEDVYNYRKDTQSYSNIFGSGLFAEDDVREALDEILDNEELKDVFNAKMMQLYKANPEINSNIAIKNVVNEMTPESIVGQEKSDKVVRQRKNEARLRQELRDKKVKEISEKEGVSLKEAERILASFESLIAMQKGAM